jgi:hypothetical protein
VTLEQPFAVVAAGEVADGGPQLLEGLEAVDPEQLFLERLDETLDAAVRLRLAVERRRAGDAKVVDLRLVVLRAEIGSAVVAERLDSRPRGSPGCRTLMRWHSAACSCSAPAPATPSVGAACSSPGSCSSPPPRSQSASRSPPPGSSRPSCARRGLLSAATALLVLARVVALIVRPRTEAADHDGVSQRSLGATTWLTRPQRY